MKEKQSFLKIVCALAIPVALQSMLQSSFSIIDQIMIGQLGEVSIAGVGFAGKFSSIFSVVAAAVGAVAGIMIAQYLGQKNQKEIRRSFYVNLIIGLLIALLFTVICLIFPKQIMGLYTKDLATKEAAAEYLVIISGTFIPMAVATMLSTLFRCMEKARLPLYASIVSALLNTVLNYIFIFGKLGLKEMGAKGAGYATLISQCVNVLLMLCMMRGCRDVLKKKEDETGKIGHFLWKQYAAMLFPILICEVAWSLGENVYAAIYGHLGTNASAAYTLTNPLQCLLIGALCGLSQAAGILIGKKLGNREYDEAYEESKKLILYGFVGAVILSVVVIFTRSYYVEIYQVDDVVKELTKQILFAYALVAPFKVMNMILGGGIIRSGGKTKYVMAIDILGTWGVGVPVGLLTAFVFHLDIAFVYFFLSLEECVRFGGSLIMFRRKGWMNSLEGEREEKVLNS